MITTKWIVPFTNRGSRASSFHAGRTLVHHLNPLAKRKSW